MSSHPLGNKRPEKAQPKEHFPLRGLLKCWCGKNMTAGLSKGKKKYYLCYRCIEHRGTNIPGDMLHQQFEELLDLLSFTKDQMDDITKKSLTLLKKASVDNAKILFERQKQLKDIDTKIDTLEYRLMDDEIDANTFKKWKVKFSQEKVVILKNIETIYSGAKDNKLEKLNKLLPLMTSIRSIYSAAPVKRKHSHIRAVFEHKLIYGNGKFRTPSIEPAFRPKALKAKEKGLLEIEEPLSFSGEIPICTKEDHVPPAFVAR